MSTLHSILTAATDLAAVVSGALPDPEPTQPPGTSGFVTIMGWVKWVALAVCIIGLIVAGAMMAINSRRGEGSEHAALIGRILAGVVIISAAATIVGFLVTA
jgi:hypothetical protein